MKTHTNERFNCNIKESWNIFQCNLHTVLIWQKFKIHIIPGTGLMQVFVFETKDEYKVNSIDPSPNRFIKGININKKGVIWTTYF